MKVITQALSLLSVAVGLQLMSQAASAQSLQLGYPGYGGNGCPQGSASVILSPDNQQLSILFDSYMVQTGSGLPTVDRKSCNLSIPVTVPNGYSYSIVQVDYRGFNSLPRQARSQLNVEYFFAGSRGVRTQKSFVGPLNDQYAVTDRLGAEAVVWSPCGAETIMRVNTSMTQFGSRYGDALSTVDSADFSSGLVYHIQFRRCR